jgi:hypothetical protein
MEHFDDTLVPNSSPCNYYVICYGSIKCKQDIKIHNNWFSLNLLSNLLSFCECSDWCGVKFKEGLMKTFYCKENNTWCL